MRRYDIPEVNQIITDGQGGAGNAIRGWFRQGRISGAKQRKPNAKIWLDAKGVLEAWTLWAVHKGYDPEADMPAGVKKAIAETASEVTVRHEADGSPVVTVIVPHGVTVKVVQAA